MKPHHPRVKSDIKEEQSINRKLDNIEVAAVSRTYQELQNSQTLHNQIVNDVLKSRGLTPGEWVIDLQKMELIPNPRSMPLSNP